MNTDNTIFIVTSGSDVIGAFANREDAVMCVVMQLSDALQFTEEGEADRLVEELMTNPKPSHKYEYDYMITETEIH